MVDRTRMVFKPNQIDPTSEFTVTIEDDDLPEATEYFEVYFTIDVNGYPFPGVARITILDDDGTG